MCSVHIRVMKVKDKNTCKFPQYAFIDSVHENKNTLLLPDYSFGPRVE